MRLERQSSAKSPHNRAYGRDAQARAFAVAPSLIATPETLPDPEACSALNPGRMVGELGARVFCSSSR